LTRFLILNAHPKMPERRQRSSVIYGRHLCRRPSGGGPNLYAAGAPVLDRLNTPLAGVATAVCAQLNDLLDFFEVLGRVPVTVCLAVYTLKYLTISPTINVRGWLLRFSTYTRRPARSPWWKAIYTVGFPRFVLEPFNQSERISLMHLLSEKYKVGAEFSPFDILYKTR
jgi:hypothetical protein